MGCYSHNYYNFLKLLLAVLFQLSVSPTFAFVCIEYTFYAPQYIFTITPSIPFCLRFSKYSPIGEFQKKKSQLGLNLSPHQNNQSYLFVFSSIEFDNPEEYFSEFITSNKGLESMKSPKTDTGEILLIDLDGFATQSSNLLIAYESFPEYNNSNTFYLYFYILGPYEFGSPTPVSNGGGTQLKASLMIESSTDPQFQCWHKNIFQEDPLTNKSKCTSRFSNCQDTFINRDCSVSSIQLELNPTEPTFIRLIANQFTYISADLSGIDLNSIKSNIQISFSMKELINGESYISPPASKLTGYYGLWSWTELAVNTMPDFYFWNLDKNMDMVNWISDGEANIELESKDIEKSFYSKSKYIIAFRTATEDQILQIRMFESNQNKGIINVTALVFYILLPSIILIIIVVVIKCILDRLKQKIKDRESASKKSAQLEQIVNNHQQQVTEAKESLQREDVLLSADKIKSINPNDTKKQGVIKEIVQNQNECGICLENFMAKSVTLSVTNCQHYFHSNCLEEWLQNHSTCPYCRADLSGKIQSNIHITESQFISEKVNIKPDYQTINIRQK